jgi:hypothetical protein
MRIRIQQTLYKTVEELHAALDSDAAHLCLAISAVRGVLCHSLPNHSRKVQAPFAGTLQVGISMTAAT